MTSICSYILMCLLLKVCFSSLTFHFKSWWFYIIFLICMSTWNVHFFSCIFNTNNENENEIFFKLFTTLHIALPESPFRARQLFNLFQYLFCRHFIAFISNTAWIGFNCRPSKSLESLLSKTELPTFVGGKYAGILFEW